MTYGLILLVIIALAAFLIIRAVRGGARLEEERVAAGCSTVRPFEEQDPVHFDAQNAPPRTPYNSDPPTSGDHSGSEVAPWGFYDEPMEPEVFVHNLEHGGTVIHYDPDIDDEEITKLEQVSDDFPEGALIIPNADLDKPVTLTAWGKMQTCETVSVQVVRAFVRENCNKGPEPVATCEN